MYTPSNQQCNQDIEHSQQSWKSPSCPFTFNPHFHYQYQFPICYHFFPFLEFYINVITQYVLFCIWFPLLSLMIWGFFRVLTCINHSFILIAG